MNAVPLRLEHVAKRYGRRAPWVLADVELELRPGSLHTVSGANGCGKSTLLRIVAGLSRPSRGAVTGRPERIALVPDRFAPPRMVARSYLEHLARLRGLRAEAAARRMRELADQLAIAPGLDAPLAEMSRGNAKKVALAQAFLTHADLIVLDEPAAALESAALAGMHGLVAAACAGGSTVVIAEHGEAAPGAVHHELADGTLALRARTASPESASRVRIRLAPSFPQASPAALEAFGAAVKPATAAGGVVTADVAADCSDAFLASALAAGWSVIELQRDPAEPA